MSDYKDTPEGKRTAAKYADIIRLSRPVSKRPHMDLVQRAKIFTPYDALRGFDEAIGEVGEETGEITRKELTDESKELLSDRLRKVRKGTRLKITCFVNGKNGRGNYLTVEGTVTRIDPVSRTLEIEQEKPDTGGGKLEKHPPTVIRFEDLV